MQMRIQISFHKHAKYMDVRVGFRAPEFEGSVVKTLRKGKVTVGVRQDGNPAYIRIRDAQELDRNFREVFEQAALERPPSEKQKNRLAKKSLQLMREIVLDEMKRTLQQELKAQEKSLNAITSLAAHSEVELLTASS